MADSVLGFKPVYRVGEYLNATKGIRKSQFQNMKDGAMAVPLDAAFGPHANELNSQIVTTNFTKRDLNIAICVPLDTKNRSREKFQNEKVITIFPLMQGSSATVSIPPHRYTVSVSEFVVDNSGARKYETRHGLKLSEIQGQVVTIYRERGVGQVSLEPLLSTQSAYVEFHNTTIFDIELIIIRPKNPFMTPEQELAEKRSRTPDAGGEKIVDVVIAANSTYSLLPLNDCYIVRAFETPSDMRPTRGSLHGETLVDPSEYDELATLYAGGGQVAIFFQSEDAENGIEGDVYGLRKIKPVYSDIVQTILATGP